MATPAIQRVIDRLRAGALKQDGAGVPDGDLLDCFVAERDEAAFEALVRRHGPMVFGVCHRILRNDADAEDAFQATFLVLVHKAASIRPRGMVSNWLYGVAHNTALKAKAMNHQRQRKEKEAGTMPKGGQSEEVWMQVQSLVDAELSLLPDKYRVPIVLCDLEGKTIKEATHHLGWPQGTVASRLTRGRALLARRLSKHGVLLSTGLLAGALSQGAAMASVPATLTLATVQAGCLLAAGKTAAASGASAAALALTDGVIKTMLLVKLKMATAVVFLATLLTAGIGTFSFQWIAGGTPTEFAESPADSARDVPLAEEKPVKYPCRRSALKGPDSVGDQAESRIKHVSPQAQSQPADMDSAQKDAGSGGVKVQGKVYIIHRRGLEPQDAAARSLVDVHSLNPGEILKIHTFMVRLTPDGRILAFGTTNPGQTPSKLKVQAGSPKETTSEKPQAKARIPEHVVALIRAWSPDGGAPAIHQGRFVFITPTSQATQSFSAQRTGIGPASWCFSANDAKLLFIRFLKENQCSVSVHAFLVGKKNDAKEVTENDVPAPLKSSERPESPAASPTPQGWFHSAP